MATQENAKKEEKGKSLFTTKVFDDLARGTSVIQTPLKFPKVPYDYFTQKPITGFNMLTINQGMKDNGIINYLTVTGPEATENNLYFEKGTKSLGTAVYDKKEAYYSKENNKDANGVEHKPGEHKLDAQGNYVPDLIFSHVFAAEKTVKTELKQKLDSNGKPMFYEKDVYRKNADGSIQRYEADTSYVNHKTQETMFFKKGDPVIEHFAGSKVMQTVPTSEHLVNASYNHAPMIKDMATENIAPTYKRANESGKEIFKEVMSNYFRGTVTGNYAGQNLSVKEITAMRTDLEGHDRLARGLAKTAWTYAMGHKEEIARIEAAVASKTQKDTVSNTNKDVNVNSNKKSRSARR